MKLVCTFLALAVILITACHKQPYANFTIDKDTCYGGETISFNNTSVDGISSKWILPNDNELNTNNATYTIDTLNQGGLQKVTLEVKNGKKTSSITKEILVNKYLFPTNYFKIDTITYKPTSVGGSFKDGYFVISAFYIKGSGFDALRYWIGFYFKNKPTSNGNFVVTQQYPINDNEVMIYLQKMKGEEAYGYKSINGNFSLNISDNDVYKLNFDNITMTTGAYILNTKYSGNISYF